MKRYFIAILVLAVIVGGLYYLYDSSTQGIVDAKQSFDSVRAQVDSLKASREATSNQIVELNKSIQDGAPFLHKWSEHYNATKDTYDNVITQIADKTGCAVIERKWSTEDVILKLGKADFETTRFEGTVMGDYRSIVKFIGNLETRLQLSIVWKMEFRVGVTGVVCSVEVYLPNFDLEGSAQ
jgi:hypothetical protein